MELLLRLWTEDGLFEKVHTVMKYCVQTTGCRPLMSVSRHGHLTEEGLTHFLLIVLANFIDGLLFIISSCHVHILTSM